VNVVAGQGSASATPILDLKSNLAGIALDFPAPLDKSADTELPLHLSLQLPPAGAPLTVSLGDVLQVRGRLADPAHRLSTTMAMNFGTTLPTEIPAQGLMVRGHAPRMDVCGTDLGALQFSFEAGAQSDAIAFDGAAVKGTIDLPTSNLATRGITADF